MILLMTGSDGIRSVAQFFTVLLVFVFVLFLTYWTTRIAGNMRKQQMNGKNIQIMETVSISSSKYLQIIKAGNRFFLIGICKDTMTYLCELKEEELDFTANTGSGETFKNILEKFKNNGQVVNNEENNN